MSAAQGDIARNSSKHGGRRYRIVPLVDGERWPVRSRSLYRVNMARARHPKKEIEGALRDAEAAGWTVTATPSGHRWGVIRCGETNRSGCQMSIWSTPRNTGIHARQVRRFIARCPHEQRPTEDEG